MKRIILPILFIGIAVTVLSVAGFVVLKYGWDWTPISYKEMEWLQDNPEQAAAEIPRIVACFERNDETLRAQAAETLSKIGPKAVDPVREKLKSKNAKVRFWAVLTLALIGPDAAGASDEVLACLNDDDADVRYKAAYALGKIGVKSDAVFRGLFAALSDKDDNVSTTAIEVLEKIGPPGPESLPMIAKLADKESPPAVRTVAIKLLGQIGKPAVPTLKELLKNADTLDTIALIQAIATLGSEAMPFLSELQAIMIKNRFWDAEEELIGTFKKCGAEGAKGLANVLETLHDPMSPYFAPDDDRSKTLLKALGEMGADAKSAIPSLMELLRERESLRLQILDVLGVTGKRAVPRFNELLKNADTLDKITLIQAVATHGPDARPFLIELQAIMIKDRFWDAQEELVSAFKKCGPEGAEGLANVLRTLHDPKSPYFAPDDDRSKALLKALGEMGAQAKSAVPVLMELLREADSMRPQILDALGGIGVIDKK